jgi:hypothetical protein
MAARGHCLTTQNHAGLLVEVTFSPEQLDSFAERVADVLEARRDDGFVGVEEAAEFLSCSRKAVYLWVVVWSVEGGCGGCVLGE